MCLMALTIHARAVRPRVGYVDMGLSVKWATCNLGATKPEECGDYYAWGETQTKTSYDWPEYKWCNGTYDSLIKYNTKSSYGDVDDKTELDAADDVARVKLGGKWHIPTDAEWTELRTNCTWTWTTQGGMNGYKVTSKINGNSIFIPAAGRMTDTYDYVGTLGFYWSASLVTVQPFRAWQVIIYADKVRRYQYFYRCHGFSVRPVTE